MPAWFAIVIQLIPALSSLVKTIGDAVKSNPPGPHASADALACHDGMCKSIDGMQAHLDDLHGHIRNAKI